MEHVPSRSEAARRCEADAASVRRNAADGGAREARCAARARSAAGVGVEEAVRQTDAVARVRSTGVYREDDALERFATRRSGTVPEAVRRARRHAGRSLTEIETGVQ